MPDFELHHHSALAGVRAIEGARIRLEALPEGTVLQLLGAPFEDGNFREIASENRLSVRENGPKDCFLVGDFPVSDLAFPDLRSEFTLVDQSHGRVRIAIEGDAVEDVLAKGTGLDLANFAVGSAATTLIGHLATHITRTAPNRFELMVLRGFAESLWHDLETMSREFI
jgi:sarcosine oxidase subunit gamma